MRGSPLLNALIAFVAIALLGIPVQRLTRATAVTAPVVAPLPAATVAKASIELQFTTPPSAARIRHLGKVVWSAEAPGSSAEAELSLPWPKEGVDLLFEITWPNADALSAAKVTVTNAAGDEQTRGIFGRGQASEVFTFH